MKFHVKIKDPFVSFFFFHFYIFNWQAKENYKVIYDKRVQTNFDTCKKKWKFFEINVQKNINQSLIKIIEIVMIIHFICIHWKYIKIKIKISKRIIHNFYWLKKETEKKNVSNKLFIITYFWKILWI